jgi:hypothetical protein
MRQAEKAELEKLINQAENTIAAIADYNISLSSIRLFTVNEQHVYHQLQKMLDILRDRLESDMIQTSRAFFSYIREIVEQLNVFYHLPDISTQFKECIAEFYNSSIIVSRSTRNFISFILFDAFFAVS